MDKLTAKQAKEINEISQLINKKFYRQLVIFLMMMFLILGLIAAYLILKFTIPSEL